MTATHDHDTTDPRLTAWFEARSRSLGATTSTTTPAGHVGDWVPAESQVAGELATPPPTGTTPHGVAAGESVVGPELDVGEAGPDGHVPILRPDPSRISLLQVTGHRAKRGGALVNMNRPAGQITPPNPQGYFHDTSSQWVTSYGCEAWLNVWTPQVALPSSPGDDHSISQFWLQNYQTPHTQSIEAGLTVDRGLNGDLSNHIFSYFTANGYASDGDNVGSYNRLHKGYVQYNATVYPGIRINGSSTQGGGQLEIGLKFQLWQGNWWLGFSNSQGGPWTWMGYYPGSLFGSGLASSAQWLSFGGEVYSALANPCSTQDQMGSGRHAAAGWTHAAYQRLLRNQSTAAGALTDFAGVAGVDSAASGCPTSPYTIQTFMTSGSNWGSYQFYGGPAT